MRFADLRLCDSILRAARAEGYTTATPIQAQAIPIVLEGRDLLGCAQTGTGKTAAFAMPILHRLSRSAVGDARARGARALVLAPTRELASQIADSFRTYGHGLHLRLALIFGGVSQNPQVESLRRGADIVVATPGRLLDLVQQRHADLRSVEVLVLDEADRMLDMGFIHDIRRIVALLPKERQTLLFSATMPDGIRQLARGILRQPATVSVAPVATPAERIEQSVYFVEKSKKPELLAHLFNELGMFRTIVFTRTKHGADKVTRRLHRAGIRAEAIHGNKSQNARQRALANFISSKTPVLVATDIASRGIDVDGITHVVNYDLTHEPETYVHRIGRTARAGASGAAISFCDRDELPNLKAIETLIRARLTRAGLPSQFGPSSATEAPFGAPVRPHARHPYSARPASRRSSPSRPASPETEHPRAVHGDTAHSRHAHPKSARPRSTHPLHAMQDRPTTKPTDRRKRVWSR